MHIHGEEIAVLEYVVVTVEAKGQQDHVPLLVVAGSGPSLLRYDWLTKLRFN